MVLAVTYAILAAVAIVINILAQDIVIRLYTGPMALAASVIAGTGAGLVAKYSLDKKFIFKFVTHSAAHNSKTFLLYALMGVGTTIIFWTFEFGFHAAFGTRGMRYLGGIIGLVIGYVAKYYLDKRFVFRTPQPRL
ncbi:MAG: GtrA family protein [Beijerinckiaceae bacterium]